MINMPLIGDEDGYNVDTPRGLKGVNNALDEIDDYVTDQSEKRKKRQTVQPSTDTGVGKMPKVPLFVPYFNLINSNSKYSLVHLVRPKLEELISRALLGLFKIRLLFQDRVTSQNLRF